MAAHQITSRAVTPIGAADTSGAAMAARTTARPCRFSPETRGRWDRRRERSCGRSSLVGMEDAGAGRPYRTEIGES